MSMWKIYAKKEEDGTISIFCYDKEEEIQYGENRWIVHHFTKEEALKLCDEIENLIKE